jgi:phage tail tape measure protein, TP901 family|nr:MAG TPA: minor tail protein [Caudoviricetes sp.]
MAAEHVIDIVVQTQDNVSPGLDRANKKMRGFEKSIERTKARLKNFAKADYEVVLRAIDRVTPAISRARETLRSITGRTYNATIGAIDRTAIKVREAQARLTALTGKAWMVTIAAKNTIAEKASGAVNGAVQSVTGMGAQMIAGAGIGYGIYDTVKTYKDFQQQMSTVAAISGASGSELDALTAKAKEMGANTAFSATEAAKAFEYMGMAGWKSSDMISGIAGIMNLAAASGEELGRVSDIVTDALTAFGLQASDSAHFADVLAQAATNSNTNVGMMGYTFKYVAPIAGTLGYSIEDVGVAIGLMASRGIKGEQAGTSLRKIFSSIASPADQAVQILDEWGISATDANGNVKPLLGTMKELRAQFKTLSKTEQLDRAYSLVGEEAKSGFLATMNASDADFDKLVESLNNAEGAAQRIGKMRLDNLAGDMEQLGGAWETFQLSIMEGKGADGLRSFIQGVSKDIDRLNEYLKDGLDISDVGRLALDILTQLKNKFLELDGIGSVLAGGVLAAGLYKIVRLAEKAGKFIKEATQSIPGGNSPSKHAPSSEDTLPAVKSMVVHAQSVVVNGAGGVPDSGGRGRKGRGRGRKPSRPVPETPPVDVPTVPKGSKVPHAPQPAPHPGTFGKMLGRGAAIAGLALGAYEAYSIYQENQQALAEAQAASDGSEESITHIKEIERENTNRMGASVGSTGGMLAGGLVGAKAGAAIGGGIGALFGVVGAAPGAAIGGFLGGVGGAIAGSEFGESIGGQLAEISEAAGGVWGSIKAGASDTWNWISNGASCAAQYVGEAWTGITGAASSAIQSAGDAISAAWDWIGDGAKGAVRYVGEQWDGFKDYVGTALSPVRMAVEDAINVIVGLGAVVWWMIKPYWEEGIAFISGILQSIKNVAGEAWDWIGKRASATWSAITAIILTVLDEITNAATEAWLMIAEVASYAWQTLKDSTLEVWSGIVSDVSAAWENICAVFSVAADWFLSTVWQPIADYATSVWAYITMTIGNALDFVYGVWGIASAWFDMAVWQPISVAVDTTGTAISDAFQSAYNFVTGLFGGIAGWFDENVIKPVSEKFDALRRIGSGITGLVGSGGGSEAPHATGGIFHAPHRGIVAENGPEAIIPLNDRTRGLDILERAATMMGLDFGDEMDFTPDESGERAPLIAPISTGNAPQSVSIELGGISIPITISGGSMDAQGVVQAIRENLEDIADDIGGQLADKVASIFGNQPVMNAG